MNKKAVIYARVSSEGDRQSTERQVEDLSKYADAAGYEVVKVGEEKASGAIVFRPVLSECIEFLKGGGADALLVTEVSRLGRTVKIVVDTLSDLTQAGVNVHVLDLGLDTVIDGRENPIASMVVTVLSLGAEMERKAIASRLNSGRDLAKKKGVRMGRPEGTSMSREDYIDKYPEVVRKLKKGTSIRDTAKICDVSPSTAARVKKMIEFILPEDQSKDLSWDSL